GSIEVFEPPCGPGIRLDSGIGTNSSVSYHFDPLLAKLIVLAPSRRAAIDRMRRALDDFVLLGVRNNIEFLSRIISTRDFSEGNLDTGFLDRHLEVFSSNIDVPTEALLVVSTVGAVYDRPGGHRPPLQNNFTDVWNSGGWRNS